MVIKIKRVDKTLPLPEYQTAGSVGFDIYSRKAVIIKPKTMATLPTNLIIETPPGFMLIMVSRSSTFRKKGIILPNAAGIFDQDFCGDNDEMLIQAYNLSDADVQIEVGERITQGIFVPVGIADWQEVDTMNNKNRGGIGSTDKN